jgi:2-iminobutanoate/2-iminopropanoate deaminase
MSTKRETITGAGVPPPVGPYSPGVRAGDFVYVAGQPGIDPASGVDPPARMVMQVPLPLGLMISIGCVAIVDSAPAG